MKRLRSVRYWIHRRCVQVNNCSAVNVCRQQVSSNSNTMQQQHQQLTISLTINSKHTHSTDLHLREIYEDIILNYKDELEKSIWNLTINKTTVANIPRHNKERRRQAFTITTPQRNIIKCCIVCRSSLRISLIINGKYFRLDVMKATKRERRHLSCWQMVRTVQLKLQENMIENYK